MKTMKTMKTMKISSLLLLIVFLTGTVKAQDYKIAVQNTKETKLVLNDFSGDLPIEGYSGSEIVISAGALDLTPPERAKGLKPVYPGGTDNTGLGLSVEKNGNQILINCLLPFSRHGDYKIRVPDNIALEIKSGCEHSNSISVTNIKNEIDIKNCHDIKIENATGPLVLSTISGNIDVICNNIAANTPFSINSVSGDIDVELPQNTAVSLEMGTVTGSFYSDFDFTQTEKGLHIVGGNQIKYELNGGGVRFSLNTVSGNIYLRKGK
jgi:lia operon protein LiaG